MATKRKSKARRKKAARRAGLRIRVIDLKKAAKNRDQLKRVLQQALRSRVAMGIFNAPFKLRPLPAV